MFLLYLTDDVCHVVSLTFESAGGKVGQVQRAYAKSTSGYFRALGMLLAGTKDVSGFVSRLSFHADDMGTNILYVEEGNVP